MTEEFLEAIKTGDTEAVKESLRNDPGLVEARSKEGLSPIFMALYSGQRETARFLLESTPEPDVFEVSVTGRTQRLRELIEEDPSLVESYSPDGFTPLGLASFFGQRDIVNFFLKEEQKSIPSFVKPWAIRLSQGRRRRVTQRSLMLF
jgi:ankyrin repeat protein